MAQTTVQNAGAIRFGSGKLEVGTSVATLVDIGAIRNAVFKEEWEDVEVKSDNAGVVKVGIKEHVAYIEGDMMEVDLANLNTIRGGLDTYAAVAGTPVVVTNELHALKGTEFVRLNFRNGAGTEVASISVKDISNNDAVRNTDFVIAVDASGFTCIARVAGSSVISDGETVKVNYTYTPNASVTLKSGGKTSISDRVVRITNTDENGKKFQITLYKGTVNEGQNIEFPADDGDDPAMPHLKMKGVLDVSRTAGDQLFEIYDEQGV
ncbi:MAG: hypothetical protein Q8J68_05575 [Methanolobus sp.]|uniref:hypothetical protein n=1 Tax=Methanolobus sp. TaxID=1874737 RepID=UPI0027319628|nr:hypothetical protein [Methanolobus sp.]MDP2216740.1 hypothetical protein [Methanolobus sp.]